MKKLVMLLLLIATATLYSTAQPLCENQCHYGPVKTYNYVICNYSWSGTVTPAPPIPPSPPDPPFPYTLSGPCVFVIVNYREVICNGIPTMVVDGVVLVDNRDYWENFFNIPYYGNMMTPNMTPCSFPTVPSTADIKKALADALNDAVASLGITSDLDVIYKGSCFSTVKLAWPQGSFILQGHGDLPGVDTIWLSGNSFTTQNIPCEDACCKIRYKFTVITGSNGETIHQWKPISLQSVDNCLGVAMPDYNNYPYKAEAFVLDPLTGQPTIVNGTVVSQEPCEPFCQMVCGPNIPPDVPPVVDPAPGFTTDVAEMMSPLEFSATPTLCNSYVKFTSNKKIVRVAVYDMSGRKVINTDELNNNELNTSGLKDGVYFIQVYFPGNEVKTIKVLKQ